MVRPRELTNISFHFDQVMQRIHHKCRCSRETTIVVSVLDKSVWGEVIDTALACSLPTDPIKGMYLYFCFTENIYQTQLFCFVAIHFKVSLASLEVTVSSVICLTEK